MVFLSKIWIREAKLPVRRDVHSQIPCICAETPDHLDGGEGAPRFRQDMGDLHLYHRPMYIYIIIYAYKCIHLHMHVAWNKLECGYAYIYNRYIHSYIHETSTVSAEAFAFCQSIEGIMLHMFWAFLILGGGCVSQELRSAIIVSHIPLYIYLYIHIYRG